ncbi:hypothetical protein MAE02_38040 [Microvirga aerophila]|uniref:Uncharacterized protein n=1 Tax=Microvirga aerophila TaxID=670291 RepID=A0A512BVW6_9HYPH|nr:hypothetical protein MAE02_38040 [Microvirga aerophila]
MHYDPYSAASPHPASAIPLRAQLGLSTGAFVDNDADLLKPGNTKRRVAGIGCGSGSGFESTTYRYAKT